MRYPYLVRRRQVYFARLTVPADLRAKVGVGTLIRTTGHTAPAPALRAAMGMVAEWQSQFAALRAGNDPTGDEAGRLASIYRRLRKDDPQGAGIFLLEDAMRFALGYTGESTHPRLAPGDLSNALADNPKAQARLDVVSGAATPFTIHIDKWIAQRDSPPRGKMQYEADVRRFADFTKKPIEQLSRKDVQSYVEHLKKDLSPKRIIAILSAVRSYWKYLGSMDLVDEDRKSPFAGLTLPQDKAKAPDEKLQAFSPEDVAKLYKLAKDDRWLAALIKLAAYTGGRIEGIGALQVSDVRTENGIRYFRYGDKTEAGIRDVPIHPDIDGLVDDLIKTADPAGYLIHSTAKNKSAERLQPLGKKFGRMKTDNGYDARYNFHGIRKTFASFFKGSHVKDDIIKEIMGHKISDLTAGTYMRPSHLTELREVIINHIKYPEMP